MIVKTVFLCNRVRFSAAVKCRKRPQVLTSLLVVVVGDQGGILPET